MRVAYVNCLRAPGARTAEALLALWPTLERVPAALRGAGIAVEVVQAANRSEVVERGGVSFRFTAGGPPSVAEAAAECRPDIVYQQGFHFGAHVWAVHRRLRTTPVLIQDHGGRPPRGWRRAIARWTAGYVGGAAFTAREQAVPYVRGGMLRRGTPIFQVLESSSDFTPGDQTAARAASGVFGDPCFLWAGRLDANKDPVTILSAFRRAWRKLPDPQLWMCYTEAPLLARVRRVVDADPGLTARVHLIGAVSHAEVEVLCRAADFFVLGSHAEGSGYALLEALACGTTPLVTDIPSFRRITAGGRVGALSPPGDVAAMAQAMVSWTGRDQAALRRAARAHFEEALSFSVVASELRAAFESLIHGR